MNVEKQKRGGTQVHGQLKAHNVSTGYAIFLFYLQEFKTFQETNHEDATQYFRRKKYDGKLFELLNVSVLYNLM